MTKIRTGQEPAPLTREQFHERFNVRFYDPAFEAEREAKTRLEAIAWEAMQEGRKSPITQPAGRGFADPGYEVSVQWLDTRKRLQAEQKRWIDRDPPGAVLLVPVAEPAEIDDRPRGLRRRRQSRPDDDPRQARGRGQAHRAAGLWHCPKHVAGRACGVVVHVDMAGVESHRRNLTDGLERAGLIDADAAAELDRCIGYREPCRNSHDELNQDYAVQEAARNAARSVVAAVKALRAGRLSQPDRQVKWPRT